MLIVARIDNTGNTSNLIYIKIAKFFQDIIVVFYIFNSTHSFRWGPKSKDKLSRKITFYKVLIIIIIIIISIIYEILRVNYVYICDFNNGLFLYFDLRIF